MTRRGPVDPALVVVLAGVSAALHIGKLPPALPVLRDALGVSLLQAGFLLSMVQMAGMTLGLLIGLAADLVGLRRSMLFGSWLLVVSSLVGGWARSGTDLLVLRAVEGFGVLFVSLPAPSLIRHLVEPHRLSRSLGLWGAYMPFGTAMALLLGPLVMGAWGWPVWWMSLAGVSACMALWLGWAVPADGPRMAPASPAQVVAVDSWRHRLGSTLSARGPWLVALCFATYSGQWLAVVGFLPSIYAQAGMGGGLLGVLTAFAAAVNMVGNIASGRLLARGMLPRHLLWIGFTAMSVGAGLAFGLPDGSSPALRYAGVLLFSAVGGLIPGTLFSLAVRFAPSPGTVSTTVGWMQQWSAIGQFAGPPVVAWMAGVAGWWQWTWVATGACSLMGMALALAIGRHRS